MIFTAENILMVGSVLIFSGILISKTGYRFGIPTLLLFLLVGMGFGSDGLGLQFNSASDAQFIGMMALSIILFSGGMDTKYSDIKPVLTPGIVLSTAGVLLTTLLTGVFIFYISNWNQTNINLTLMCSLLLAATMSSTDSASVFNLLRSQRMNLKQNLRPMLELESGSNDPVAYMLTIVLIQVISSGSSPDFLLIIKDLLVQFFFGGVIGYAMGRFSVWLINRGNTRLAFRKEISTFMNGLTWLFQIVIFITLGLLVNPHEMLDITAVGLLIGVFMILVARPLSVFLCLLPFRNITNKGRLFVSWVGLRGATPIIFATYPVLAQIEGSQQLFNIVFFITLLSLVIQGMTITKAAKILQLDLPAPKEGNEFGVELPEEIDTHLNDLTLTAEMLEDKNRLAEMQIPKGTLVMLVKRGNEFLIPNGQMELKPGDKLLLISENKNKSAD